MSQRYIVLMDGRFFKADSVDMNNISESFVSLVVPDAIQDVETFIFFSFPLLEPQKIENPFYNAEYERITGLNNEDILLYARFGTEHICCSSVDGQRGKRHSRVPRLQPNVSVGSGV